MLPGEREAARREGSLYVSLPFRCNPRKTPNEPPTLIQTSQVQDGKRTATCCPREEQRALSSQVPEQKKEGWEGGSGRTRTPPWRAGLSNTILGAPPIGRADQRRLRGGNFLGPGPSASLAAPGQHLPKERAFLLPPTCVRMHASQSSNEPRGRLSPKSPSGSRKRSTKFKLGGEEVTVRHKKHSES